MSQIATQQVRDANGSIIPGTTSSFLSGSKSSIGASALQLTSTSTPCSGVYIKRSSSETGIVYVGTSTVTAGTTDATDGFPIEAGDSLFVSVDDPSKVYVIGSTTGLKVFYMITY